MKNIKFKIYFDTHTLVSLLQKYIFMILYVLVLCARNLARKDLFREFIFSDKEFRVCKDIYKQLKNDFL